EQSERLSREQKWKSSKPPVTKVKLGLDLKQHELSVIPEVDTPKSCNVSFADRKDSVGREFSPVAITEDLAYMKHYGHTPHEEGSLPSSITDYREQIYHGSPRQSKQSSRLLQEVLLLTDENPCDS
ncbi:CE295 protein, partial [Eubucco bourcierii]|nr:CE295 protein [Eubucco bourcierii]